MADLSDVMGGETYTDDVDSTVVTDDDGNVVGGEHAYDVVDYDSDTSTDSADSDVSSGWDGGIGGGLMDVYGEDSDGDGVTDSQETQIDAVDDATDEFTTGTDAQEASEEWWNRNTPDVPGDSDGDGIPDNWLGYKLAALGVVGIAILWLLRPVLEIISGVTN